MLSHISMMAAMKKYSPKHSVVSRRRSSGMKLDDRNNRLAAIAALDTAEKRL